MTPEEVLTKWKREHILDKGGIPTAGELIDLVHRSMAAQREANAQVVEGLACPGCREDRSYLRHVSCRLLFDAAAAIRAGE